MPSQLETVYSKLLKVVQLVGEGKTLTVACDESDVGITTFKKWEDRDPTLHHLYSEAKQRGLDALEEALLTIKDHPIYGDADPRVMAVVSKNIMWVLSKRSPKRFGDRSTIDITMSADRTIANALAASKARVLSAPVIEGAFEEIEQGAIGGGPDTEYQHSEP